MDILDNIDHHGNQITNSYLQGTATKVSNPITIRTKSKLKGTFDGSEAVDVNLVPKDFNLPDSFQWDDGTPITPNNNNVLVLRTIRGYQGFQGLQGLQGLQGYQGLKGTLTEATYTNPLQMPADLGGLSKGTSFDNVNYIDLLNRLLYPYVKPSIQLDSNLASRYFEIGDIYEGPIKFVARLTRGLNDFDQVDFLVNNSVASTILDMSSEPTYSMSNLKTTTSVSSRIKDKISNGQGGQWVNSNSFNYYFVRPVYVGLTSLSPNNDNINEIINDQNTIKKLVATGSTITYTSTIFDAKRYFILTPEGWNLSKILDSNGFDNTATFLNNWTVGNVTALDGNLVKYNIYYGNITSKNNSYTLTFEFN